MLTYLHCLNQLKVLVDAKNKLFKTEKHRMISKQLLQYY